ncbi:hypothetical protein LTR56_017131 [Elasticomyces elasticus]|nr:hypothetical protein LTR22_021799 [Elasticomyces elasticus]KAK3630986.1 hypothetical protein LTR56_017131 [Elasticomyces elasticus]KAK4908799.1 hypothetical protein LTR49_022365 [Elasticomyces elasticus]KAK5748801.1 hypothetical protein LTS12_021152 [Elasticomyces elasticus]
MILRTLMLRHGRLALPKSTPLAHFRQRRNYASEIESTYTNPHADQQFIAGGIGGSKSQAVQSATTTTSTPTTPDPNQVLRDYEFSQHQKAVTSKIGSTLAPHYRPHELLSNPPSPKDITLELLLASQAHIGHSTSLWHPANAKYIFGVLAQTPSNPIHIISLDATAAYLRRAAKIVSGVTERGGLVLFVGSRGGQASTVVRAAGLAGGCHLFTKWIPGTITNGQQILGKCGKKVVDHTDTLVPGFEEQLVKSAAVKPDLVVCLNMLENYVLLHECALNNIPTIGILDTDCNPTWITYPIPANDDSLRSVQVIAGVLGRAGEEGQKKRRLNAARGRLPMRQDHGLEAPGEEGEGVGGLGKEMAALLAAERFGEDEVELEGRDVGGEVEEVDGSLLGEDGMEEEGEGVPYERDEGFEGGAEDVNRWSAETGERMGRRSERFQSAQRSARTGGSLGGGERSDVDPTWDGETGERYDEGGVKRR